MNTRVFNAKDGDSMNVWYCAAMAFGGGDAPPVLPLPASQPEAVLEAKPVSSSPARSTAPCTDCGGKVLARPAVTRQPLLGLAASDSKKPTAAAVQSSGPVSVELQPVSSATMPKAVAPEPSVTEVRPSAPSVVIHTSAEAPPKKTWLQRLFGRPAQSQPRTSESQAITPAAAEPTVVTGRTTWAARLLRRESWRAPETAPVSHDPPTAFGTVAQAPPAQMTPVEPMQLGMRELHTTRKPQSGPTSMLRDASVWQYSKQQATDAQGKGAIAPPAHGSTAHTTSKPDWPTKVDLPEPPQGTDAAQRTSLPPWTDEVIRKTMELNAEQNPSKGTPVPLPVPVEEKKAPAPSSKSDAESLFGKVAWTHTGGGHWLLKAESGRQYLLKGDDSLLRLRVGDHVEVSGVVNHSDMLGMASMDVQKVSFMAKR